MVHTTRSPGGHGGQIKEVGILAGRTDEWASWVSGFSFAILDRLAFQSLGHEPLGQWLSPFCSCRCLRSWRWRKLCRYKPGDASWPGRRCPTACGARPDPRRQTAGRQSRGQITPIWQPAPESGWVSHGLKIRSSSGSFTVPGCSARYGCGSGPCCQDSGSQCAA